MGLPNNLPYGWADDDSDKYQCKKKKKKTKKTKKHMEKIKLKSKHCKSVINDEVVKEFVNSWRDIKRKKADVLEKKETRLAYVAVCQALAGLEALIFAVMFEYGLLFYIMAILFILALFHARLCLLAGKEVKKLRS